MVSRRSFLALLAVALAGLAAWRLLVPSEERRIRKTFDRASRLLAKEGTEPVFAAAAKARDLAALVAPNAHLDIPERNLDFRLNGEGLARQIALVRISPLSFPTTTRRSFPPMSFSRAPPT